MEKSEDDKLESVTLFGMDVTKTRTWIICNILGALLGLAVGVGIVKIFSLGN